MSTRLSRWWQPELALVLALPLAALAGGVLTLRASAVDLSVDGVDAGVRRTAQVQTAQLDPDLAAARRGLLARLEVDRVRGLVRVRVPAPGAATQGLRLDFLHPLHAHRDLHVRLRADGAAFVAPLAPARDSHWRVVLSDPARSWRLVGTLPRGSEALALQPALPLP